MGFSAHDQAIPAAHLLRFSRRSVTFSGQKRVALLRLAVQRFPNHKEHTEPVLPPGEHRATLGACSDTCSVVAADESLADGPGSVKKEKLNALRTE